MSLTTRLTAMAACTTLLLGGLTALPAHGEDGTAVPAPTTVTLNLSYAGAAEKQVVITGATTVGDAIAILALKVDSNDRVAPALDAPLTDGMSLVVDVVSTKTFSKKVTLKKKTIYKKTKSLYKGDRKVVAKGRNGKATRTYLTTVVNGVATTAVVKQKVTTKVRNRVVKVGSNGKRTINLARSKKWDKIAKCESGRRWHINTGNGYYGGLQFSRATWRSVKGYHFASYPHKATRAEQITVANRLHARRGFKPWSCRHVL
jgi:resuscitation-promoting factor RpfB